jgi:hypothetical protein
MDIVSINVDLPTQTTDPPALLATLEPALSAALHAGDLIGADTIANLMIVIGRAQQMRLCP